MDHPLKGAWVALYTPFLADGSVDWVAYRALCARVVGADVGLVPCGTTAETPTLTQEEYDKSVRIAVEVAAGAMPVIVGTGGNSTAKTVVATQHAKRLGADAALVVTPYYNRPSQAGIIQHYRAVADDGGLPVVLYNVPARTGRNMLSDTTLALSQHSNIVAVKEASGDIVQINRIINSAPADFSVLSGDDGMTLPLILCGGHGVVSVAGNIAPARTNALVQAALSGDLTAARVHQQAMLPLFGALFGAPNPVPVKVAGQMLGHHDSARVRLPLTSDSFTTDMQARLQAGMARAGLL